MGFFKFILSRIAGRAPSVNQMDTMTLSWNIRDGILFGLKVSESGTKEVVPIGGAGPGTPGADAFVYIGYASDNSGSDFTMVFSSALDYIAILSTDTEIPTPGASDFAGLWKKYKGEQGQTGSQGPVGPVGPAGPDGLQGPEGVGVPTGGTTGQVLKKISEHDFETAWQNEQSSDNYHHWSFNVDTENGDVETDIPSEEKIYFKRGSGINFKRSSHVELGNVIEIETTQTNGSTQLTALPIINKTASGLTSIFTANENQAFGDVVFINPKGKAQLAMADTISNATALAMVIEEAVRRDEDGKYILLGFVRNDSWEWSIGSWIYLSLSGTSGNTLSQTNPADIPCSEDNVIQLLGVANSATSFYFNPQLVQVEYKT